MHNIILYVHDKGTYKSVVGTIVWFVFCIAIS